MNDNQLVVEIIIRRGNGNVVLKLQGSAFAPLFWQAPGPMAEIAQPGRRDTLTRFRYQPNYAIEEAADDD